MTTTTRQTKACKITRHLNLGEAVNGLIAAGVTEVHHRTGEPKIVVDNYFLRRQPSDFGVAFQVEKFGGETYDVLLNAPGGGHSCDCKWGCYGGHKKPCRHIELALQAVREHKI
jgi:hypothetical protein